MSPEPLVLNHHRTVTGAAAAEWLASVYGMQLNGWQRHALDRTLEHDEDGRLVSSVVVLTVGRQSGKSWLSKGIHSG